MKSVNIALLKAQLSKFLRLVKNGEEVLVMDRNHIVAKIVPYYEVSDIKVRAAQGSIEGFFAKCKPVRTKVKTDVVAELNKERGDR